MIYNIMVLKYAYNFNTNSFLTHRVVLNQSSNINGSQISLNCKPILPLRHQSYFTFNVCLQKYNNIQMVVILAVSYTQTLKLYLLGLLNI